METDTPQLKKRKMSPEVGSIPAAPEQPFLVKRLSKNAKLPTRGSALAAGYDLYRCVCVIYLYTGVYIPMSVI